MINCRADTWPKRERENENLALFHWVFPSSLGLSRTLCLPFTWTQAQSTGSQAWLKASLYCTKREHTHARKCWHEHAHTKVTSALKHFLKIKDSNVHSSLMQIYTSLLPVTQGIIQSGLHKSSIPLTHMSLWIYTCVHRCRVKEIRSSFDKPFLIKKTGALFVRTYFPKASIHRIHSYWWCWGNNCPIQNS